MLIYIAVAPRAHNCGSLGSVLLVIDAQLRYANAATGAYGTRAITNARLGQTARLRSVFIACRAAEGCELQGLALPDFHAYARGRINHAGSVAFVGLSI